MIAESYLNTLRNGLLPLLSEEAVAGLATAIETRDRRLIHQGTTFPAPIEAVMDWTCEGGCLVAFPGLLDGLETVREVEDFFFQLVGEIEARMGEPQSIRYLTNPWDTTDEEERQEVRAVTLLELRAELGRRRWAVA